MALGVSEPSFPSRFELVDLVLAEQQETAVERFAQSRQGSEPTPRKDLYRDLIPLSAPAEGEQYAFEVDLDHCSGCKSCVAACHNLNGLEPGELWRNVGLLHGGTQEQPVLQHVTTACHHCIDPACLQGCPVLAYEKDPITGIVRHLDDQCIGCQYCVFKCPYDVPVYSRAKGIVRKCDMCRDRLLDQEAPACAAACPNQAIRIRVVGQEAIVEAAETNQFLPGAPEPGYTLPTTVYKSDRPLARNLLPADYYTARRQPAHWPLVVMLVLTQMSVGAFVAEQWLPRWETASASLSRVQLLRLVFALFLGLLGLGAAVLHLGRPLYAFRAILGLRTSWLSREIVAFGGYATLAAAQVGLALGSGQIGWMQQLLGVMAAALGVAGVVCSVMIYVDTQRPFWSWSQTAPKFFLTAAILGLPLSLLNSLIAALAAPTAAGVQFTDGIGARMCQILFVLVVMKIALECSIFSHLRNKQHTSLKRTALLLSGDLSMAMLQRLFFAAIGGVVLPWMLLSEQILAPERGFAPPFIAGVTVLMLILLTAGELIERQLFFAASAAPKMPGTPAS